MHFKREGVLVQQWIWPLRVLQDDKREKPMSYLTDLVYRPLRLCSEQLP